MMWLEWRDDDEKRRLKDIYKMTKTEERMAVTSAKTIVFECLYEELSDKGEDKRLYKLTKGRERKEIVLVISYTISCPHLYHLAPHIDAQTLLS